MSSTSCEHLDRLECTTWVTIDRGHFCPPCGADRIQHLLSTGTSPAAIAKATSFPEFHSSERHRRNNFIRKLVDQLNNLLTSLKRDGRNADANRVDRAKTLINRRIGAI